MGLNAGFNWAGVSQAKRRRARRIKRKVNGSPEKFKTDGPDMLEGNKPRLLRRYSDFRY